MVLCHYILIFCVFIFYQRTEGFAHNPEWRIINMADMQVDSKGNEVDVIDRLRDIRDRYGDWSDQYLTACDICYRIGLTAVNLAGMDT